MGPQTVFLNGPKVSRWAKKGPKLSKRFTTSDPFGPLWNVDKPAMFGHFCLFYWCVFWDILYKNSYSSEPSYGWLDGVSSVLVERMVGQGRKYGGP